MKPVHLFTLLLAGVLPALLRPAQAEAETDAARTPEPLELRRIMQQMDKDMQAVVGAIAREDWGQVARIAPRIADHPQPPVGEKMRILAFIGTDVKRFKGFDSQTHAAATAMQQAAQRGDGREAIAAFAEVQRSCLGCHEAFRKPFVAHFYGEAAEAAKK